MEGKSKIDTYGGPATEMEYWHQERAHRRPICSTTTVSSAAGAVFRNCLFDGQVSLRALVWGLSVKTISYKFPSVLYCPLGGPSPIVPDSSSGAVIASILLYSDSLIMMVVQA
ncbi:hypothetical protein Acr_00g0030400 [Actinidia rufa]|uniref:Uncharacterized protein n=1 Tax=Actinidia rufa TaxID=165716 RepID=A0A7J0DF24_9ERIC|nr:hypothetical protein Acr_00g0030400 [Actinidia rufa]